MFNDSGRESHGREKDHPQTRPRVEGIGELAKFKKPVFFGAVTAKSYVAFHFMPIYVFPELLDGISPELRRRMQGKSCFNFKAVDKPRFKELEALTKAGFARFKAAGLI